MPAPRRGANTSGNAPKATATHDMAIDNYDPTWNTSLAKLPPYLAALKRNDLLFNQVRDSLSLVTPAHCSTAADAGELLSLRPRRRG